MDIIFTALPNGQAQSLSNLLNKNNILIDLSADFRLTKQKSILSGMVLNITQLGILKKYIRIT